MTDVLRVLSLGGGVQSTTLLRMILAGEFADPPTCAVFADTQWEPSAVYAHLWKLAEECAAVGFPLYVVATSSLRDDALDPAHRVASMPFFVRNPAGKLARARRQCTKEYKIVPIGRFIRRQLLGLAPGRSPRRGQLVEQWFGISWDEAQRVAMPRVQYMRHRYPLVDRRMTRGDCVRWLADHGHAAPPKSSCIGCPFHGDQFWRELQANAPDEWADAVDFDRSVRRIERDGRTVMSGELYLHRALIPLDEVDMRTPEERGQGALFDGADYAGECDSGYCFI